MYGCANNSNRIHLMSTAFATSLCSIIGYLTFSRLVRVSRISEFLPCDALRCTVFVIVILSVRPSVRLSVCLSHSWTVSTWFDIRSWFFSPYGSLIILVSDDIKFIPKFEGGHPERGRWMRVGWVRIGDFRPISRHISETMRDTT